MADSGRKSTIYDIAQIAGASPSTGSAALSDNWRARRISEAKVENIRRIAEEQGFSVNMQARGLRRARSGMVGLIIPVHDDRYFSSMSQSVEVLARERGLVPVIASSMRNADEELRLVETLSRIRSCISLWRVQRTLMPFLPPVPVPICATCLSTIRGERPLR